MDRCSPECRFAVDKNGTLRNFDIMGGLMVGILLSRPAASFLAGIWSWKGFFVGSAICSALLCATLAIRLPERRPATNVTYGALIGSLWELFRDEPVLLKRAIMAAIVMAAFNIFWTSIVSRWSSSLPTEKLKGLSFLGER
jgi:MFS family permease